MEPGRAGARRLVGRDVAREGVAEAVNRAQQAGRLRVVADRGPDLGREPGEARVRDEAVRPEPLVDLLLGDGPRPLLEQQLEELERLGGEGLRDAVPPELPRLAVEQAPTEAHPHGRTPGEISVPEEFANDLDRREWDYAPNTTGHRDSDRLLLRVVPARSGRERRVG